MNGIPLILRGSVTEQKEILPLRYGANLLDSVQHAMIRRVCLQSTLRKRRKMLKISDQNLVQYYS